MNRAVTATSMVIGLLLGTAQAVDKPEQVSGQVAADGGQKILRLACVGDSITEGFCVNNVGILEQIPLVDQAAKDVKAGVIDIHGALKAKGKPAYNGDGGHPNDAGQTIIATTVHAALTNKATKNRTLKP